jgi:preprotein translocase subunit SecB
MSDENAEKLNGNPGATTQPNGPVFAIQRVYIKDMSFETSNTPQVFQQAWRPNIELDINTSTTKLQDNVYTVMVRITATAKNEEKTVFVAEVQQVGIFSIQGFEQERLHHMLGSYCPNILFPFAREAISDMVVRASFPPLYLAPVNFDAVYEQQVKQGAAAAAAEKEPKKDEQ